MPQKRNTITLVCTGNTCRSPMAERLLRHALDAQEEPFKSLRVASAGIAAVDGAVASAHSVKALEKVGITLKDHQSRMLTQGLIDRSFAIFGMTTSHVQGIQMYFEPNAPYIGVLRTFLPESQGHEIPDPIGGSLRDYEICRDTMVEAIPSIISFLRKEYPAS